MKIAIIAHCLYPIIEPFEGGLEMITYLLCKSLIERGHEVDLYAHPDSDSQFNIIPIRTDNKLSQGLCTEMADFGHTQQTLQEVVGYTKVMSDIQSRDYDIIHNHSLHYLPILLGNQKGLPFITTLHTPPFPFLRFGAFGVLDDSEQIFTMVSKSLSKTWRKFIPNSRVVYNGIDISKWNFTVDHSEDYLIWYGRVCPEKGTALAIKAAIKAGVRIILVGPNSNTSYFEKEVQPFLINPLVKYLGHRTQSELMPLLSNARAMLFTSTWEEPFGLTLAESLACGTPIIAFEGGATREIITADTGYIVPKNDVAALSRMIKAVGSLSRKACRRRGVDFCSHEIMVDGYIAIYREVMNKGKIQIAKAV